MSHNNGLASLLDMYRLDAPALLRAEMQYAKLLGSLEQNTTPPHEHMDAKTASGFSIRTRRTSNGVALASIPVYWKATKDFNG